MQTRSRLTLAGLILLGLAASAIAWYTTHWGVWAGSDSAVYITAARNFIAGIGLRVIQPSGKPATLLAPAYPLLLAGLGMLKISLLDVARWLNILFFGVTTFLSGFAFYKFSHTPWFSIPLSILAVVFPAMVDLHSGMMTEPLYLLSAFLGMIFLFTYQERSSRFYLVGAAIFSGISIITRFIGFYLLPVGIAVLLIFGSVSWKRRLIDAGLYTIISLAPFIAWYVWFSYNPDVSSPLRAYQSSNLVVQLKLLRDGLMNVFWGWVPFQSYLSYDRKIEKYLALLAIMVIFLGLPAAGLIKLYGRQLKSWLADRDSRLFGIFGLYCLGFLFTFGFIYLFRTPVQDINDRTLLPLYQPILCMLFAGISLLGRAFSIRSSAYLVKSLPWLAVVVGVVAYLPASATLALHYHQDGSGYTSPAWRNSETLQALQQLPADISLISNNTGVIMFYTGRSALEIEEIFTKETLPEYSRYGDNPNSANEKLFRLHQAALVLWEPSFYWQLYDIYQAHAQARLDAFVRDLTLDGQYNDGAIYFYPSDK